MSEESDAWEAGTISLPKPAVGFLADALDPRTGELLSISTGVHPIDAEVVFVLRAAFNAGPALQGVGTRFGDLRKITDETSIEIAKIIREALDRFVKRGDIRIDKILTAQGARDLGASDMAAALVVYTNLQTGKSGIKVQVIP